MRGCSGAAGAARAARRSRTDRSLAARHGAWPVRFRPATRFASAPSAHYRRIRFPCGSKNGVLADRGPALPGAGLDDQLHPVPRGPDRYVPETDRHAQGGTGRSERRLPHRLAIDREGSARRDCQAGLVQLEADEPACDARVADAKQRVASDEIPFVEADVSIEAGFERVGRLVDVPRIDVVDLFETKHAHRPVPRKGDSGLLSGAEQCVVHRPGMTRVVEDLVAQLTGHPEPCDQAIDAGDVSLHEPKVRQRLGGKIDVGHPRENLARCGALHLEARRAGALIDHLRVEPPDSAADPRGGLVDVERGHGEQKPVGSEAEHDQIIEYAAFVGAERAVEAPPRLGKDVPRAKMQHRCMGPRAPGCRPRPWRARRTARHGCGMPPPHRRAR